MCPQEGSTLDTPPGSKSTTESEEKDDGEAPVHGLLQEWR